MPGFPLAVLCKIRHLSHQKLLNVWVLEPPACVIIATCAKEKKNSKDDKADETLSVAGVSLTLLYYIFDNNN